MAIDKPRLSLCNKVDFPAGVYDPVENASTFEETVACALIQIRNLLAKIAYSVAPTIDRSYITSAPADKFEKVYSSSDDKVIEIQNISHLSGSPNDLIIQAAFIKKGKNIPKDLGLVIRPNERLRLHIPAGNAIYAKFLEEASYLAISELMF